MKPRLSAFQRVDPAQAHHGSRRNVGLVPAAGEITEIHCTASYGLGQVGAGDGVRSACDLNNELSLCPFISQLYESMEALLRGSSKAEELDALHLDGFFWARAFEDNPTIKSRIANKQTDLFIIILLSQKKVRQKPCMDKTRNCVRSHYIGPENTGQLTFEVLCPYMTSPP